MNLLAGVEILNLGRCEIRELEIGKIGKSANLEYGKVSIFEVLGVVFPLSENG